MSWIFNHVQTYLGESAPSDEQLEVMTLLGQAWLKSADSHVDKSGVARFAFHDSEVTVIRRVVVTSLDGIVVPQRASEVILIRNYSGHTIAMSSRGFHMARDDNHVGMALDDVDRDFFTSVDLVLRSPQNETALPGGHDSVEVIVNLLECKARERWVLIPGPGSRTRMGAEDLSLLSSSLGVLADVVEVHEDTWVELNDELGLSFSIPRDGLRIFAPGFDLENDLDARRHPSLASIPFSAAQGGVDYSDERIRRVSEHCASISQGFAGPYGDLELQDQILQEFLTVEVANVRANNKDLLYRDGVDVDDLRFRIDDLANQLEFAIQYGAHWEGEFNSAHLELSETHLDLFITNSELEDERRANSYLRHVLARQSIFDTGMPRGDDRWSDVPNTFIDLIGRCNELPFLRFTGSLDPARQLDAQPRMDVAVSRAWDALHALSDYARLKQGEEFIGGLHEYMTTGIHSGYKIGPNSLAMSEGEQVNVNPVYRESRTFSVPEEVSGGGFTFMEAHIKLVTGSANSPRMHFLDNTGGDDLVYIGYIGRHLPSPQTN